MIYLNTSSDFCLLHFDLQVDSLDKGGDDFPALVELDHLLANICNVCNGLASSRNQQTTYWIQ